MANQTDRVMELIKQLKNNQIICIDTLKSQAMWEGKSERTIFRDLDYLKEYFELKSIPNNKGCYKVLNTSLIENFLTPETLSMLIQTFYLVNRTNLLKSINISKQDKSILEKEIKNRNKIYDFKNFVFENDVDFEKFKKLEYVIKYQKYTTIKYKSIKDEINEFIIKPYKIVFLNGNFYLASEIENKNFTFTLYRISRIMDIQEQNREFHKKFEIEDFIKQINTPFAKYTPEFRKNLIDVEIELNENIAKFFKEKKFFPSQQIKIINNKTIVTYKVTQLLEIKNFLKQWIPDIKILKPIKLNEIIKEELEMFLIDK